MSASAFAGADSCVWFCMSLNDCGGCDCNAAGDADCDAAAAAAAADMMREIERSGDDWRCWVIRERECAALAAHERLYWPTGVVSLCCVRC